MRWSLTSVPTQLITRSRTAFSRCSNGEPAASASFCFASFQALAPTLRQVRSDEPEHPDSRPRSLSAAVRTTFLPWQASAEGSLDRTVRFVVGLNSANRLCATALAPGGQNPAEESTHREPERDLSSCSFRGQVDLPTYEGVRRRRRFGGRILGQPHPHSSVVRFQVAVPEQEQIVAHRAFSGTSRVMSADLNSSRNSWREVGLAPVDYVSQEGVDSRLASIRSASLTWPRFEKDPSSRRSTLMAVTKAEQLQRPLRWPMRVHLAPGGLDALLPLRE